MEGWRLTHDPNYEADNEEALHELSGNKFRDVWKLACWSLMKEVEFSIYRVLRPNLSVSVSDTVRCVSVGYILVSRESHLRLPLWQLGAPAACMQQLV